MASPITWVLRVKIQDGAHDAFQSVMKEMVASTEREPGALVYDWFVDGDIVHILERYPDSEAVIEHLTNFGTFAERFLGSVHPTEFTVYGDPSAQAREALAAFGPSYCTPLATIGV